MSKELEYSSNVSSAIMMKVPTQNLVGLRAAFEAEENGLNLVQFLKELANQKKDIALILGVLVTC